MKITDTKEAASQAIQQYNASKSVRPEARNSAAPPPGEKVELSSDVKDLQYIKKAVDELPDVREDKVLDLKKQIQEGTYNVNGEKIAQKMLGESLLDIFA
jgi:negative regulator of flagellin synthesis FlgM